MSIRRRLRFRLEQLTFNRARVQVFPAAIFEKLLFAHTNAANILYAPHFAAEMDSQSIPFN